MNRQPLVTLTTDFGTRDPYVAAMKGVVADICPNAYILDLTHEIAPQDVLEAAIFLAGACDCFPPNTIHVAVVDPGVGSDRRPVAVRAGGQTYVCPDNGMLTLIAQRHPVQDARAILNPAFMRERVSNTFHGRDVFAPTAAHLAAGWSLRDVGPEAGELVTLAVPAVESPNQRLLGQVIRVDRFGNLITNIPGRMLEPIRDVAIHVAGVVVRRLSGTYSDVSQGELLALVGSMDLLEVSVNGGNAARFLGVELGMDVEVRFTE